MPAKNSPFPSSASAPKQVNIKTRVRYFQLIYYLESMHRFHMVFNFIISEEGSVTNIAHFLLYLRVHSFYMRDKHALITE